MGLKMKKLIISAIALTFIWLYDINAVEPNCRNECYESIPYTVQERLLVMSGCPSCTVRVVFLTRYGICEGLPVRDIYIESMTGLGGGCSYGSCQAFDHLPSLIREIVEQILARYRWDDLQEEEVTNVKVKYPPCMRAIGKRSRIFCLNGECCIHEYRIMVQRDTNSILHHKGWIQRYEGECPVYENVQCENICSVYVPGLGDPILLEVAKQEFADEDDFQVAPNPIDKKVVVKIPRTFEALSLEIYNYLGNLTYKQDPLVVNGRIEIYLSKYPSGLYYLVIKKLGGQTLKKYFIINH